MYFMSNSPQARVGNSREEEGWSHGESQSSWRNNTCRATEKAKRERENCSRATEGPKEEAISRKWQTRRRGNTEEMVFVEEMVGMVYVYV